MIFPNGQSDKIFASCKFLLHWGSCGGIFELIRPWAEKYFFDLMKKVLDKAPLVVYDSGNKSNR